MSAEPLLTALTAGLRRASLDEVLAAADLQARVDRKYVVRLECLSALLDRVGDQLHVLQIGEHRAFRYESVYFDTPGLLSYHQHAHGRRRRTKVRTRAYLDSGECLLEFKRVGSRGETVKERYPYPLGSRFDLDADARALAAARLGATTDVPALEPTLTTLYRRTTLVDTVRGTRVTCDVDLRFERPSGQSYGPATGLVVLESKSRGGDAPTDRVLRSLGARPVSLSKYCVGMAVLDHGLPANRWNRELRAYFAWAPQRPGAVSRSW
ncbi:VTC domain-containing protein [Nocardioides sp. SYSU D00065]|uniref:VTC domain-containing protein n=1 Tax=Nocardioides sp. SYSU D00065 TaxID=2817378 RepID=UPI001B319319|nr:VTC domain-containing protein [Nocardioides sp. SYSU D00065]